MKPVLLLFLSLALSLSVFAQRDLPVSGNAATLVDLLRKDYSSIAPENRFDEISRDQTLIISIFKSYLSDSERSQLESSAQPMADLQSTQKEMNALKKKMVYYSAGSPNDLKDSKNADPIVDALKRNADSLEDKTKKYYQDKASNDCHELETIGKVYARSCNMFLSEMIEKLNRKYLRINAGKQDDFSAVNTNSSIQKSIPFIGGDLSFETVVDGLSKFLAKRIKEELTAYVMESVKTWLQKQGEDDPLAEFKVILPQTTLFLTGFTADKISSFPGEIKQYIEDDLNHLLDNAPGLRQTPRLHKLISNHPDLDFAMEALEIIPDLSKIKTPADYFSIVERSRNLSRWKTSTDTSRYNIANGIYLSGLLARSLMVTDNGELKFASMDWLGKYAAESEFFLLYTGFLYQQNLKYYDICFVTGHSGSFQLAEQLGTIIQKKSTDISLLAFKTRIEDALNKAAKNAEKIYVTSADIKKAKQAGLKVAPDTVYAFIKSVIGFSEDLTGSVNDLLNEMAGPINISHPANQKISFDLPGKTAPFYNVARTVNDVYIDISQKRYASALIKLAGISSALVHNNQFPTLIADIQTLGRMRADKRTAAWHLVIGLATRNDPAQQLHLDTREVAAVKTLQAELTKLALFARINYPDSPVANEHTGVPSLVGICGSGALTGILGVGDLVNLRTVLERPDFQKLVVSFYTGILIDDLLSKITKELSEITVMNSRNIPVKVFTENDAAQIAFAASAYVAAIYSNYYIRGHQDNDQTLVRTKDFLFSTIANYVSVLPQKFDIASNTQLVSLIHFVNDLALAKNSDEVAEALDTFALPAGSYTVKRATRFNLSINSYPGILPAAEFAGGKVTASVGFTAPVGFGLSWGNKGGCVNGVFLPVIDIGALTRLRLFSADSTVKTLPEFKFKNIFSPGIYFSHGFKKSPIAVNIGIQYGPDLQVIKADGSTSGSGKDAFRVGAGIVIDIPLFNLHSTVR